MKYLERYRYRVAQLLVFFLFSKDLPNGWVVRFSPLAPHRISLDIKQGPLISSEALPKCGGGFGQLKMPRKSEYEVMKVGRERYLAHYNSSVYVHCIFIIAS